MIPPLHSFFLSFFLQAFVGILYPALSLAVLYRLHRKARSRARRRVREEGAGSIAQKQQQLRPLVFDLEQREVRLWQELAEREYCDNHWYFSHLNMARALLLAFSAAFFSSDGMDMGVWGLVIDMIILVFLGVMYWLYQPFPAGCSWKREVQQLLLVTSFMLASLGICGAVQAERGEDGGTLGAVVQVLGLVVMGLMCCMFYKLCTCFYFEVILGKPKDTLLGKGKGAAAAEDWEENPMTVSQSGSKRAFKPVRSLSAERLPPDGSSPQSAGPPRGGAPPRRAKVVRSLDQRVEQTTGGGGGNQRGRESIASGAFELTTTGCVVQLSKGSTERVAAPGGPEKRIDSDGLWYTREQFTEFYGEWADKSWAAALQAPSEPGEEHEQKSVGRLATLRAMLTRGTHSAHTSKPKAEKQMSRMALVKSMLGSTGGGFKKSLRNMLSSNSLPRGSSDRSVAAPPALADITADDDSGTDDGRGARGWSTYDKALAVTSARGKGSGRPGLQSQTSMVKLQDDRRQTRLL
jgi:hypothetical protein